MKHARDDYNRIQDPENKIGQDEPVFLLRGKDQCAPDTIRFWANILLARGGAVNLYSKAMAWAKNMEKWQQENGCKIPDAPKG